MFGDVSHDLCRCTWRRWARVPAVAVCAELAAWSCRALGTRASGEACASAEARGRNTTGSAARGLVQFMLQQQGKVRSW